MSERYGWTGHNFPSEGWGSGAGSSTTWFRDIADKRFMFTLWMNSARRSTYIVCMDVSNADRSKWTTRHGLTF